MNRFLIFDPTSKTYVRMFKGGWTSGHTAEEVNSFGSAREAMEEVRLFDRVNQWQVIEVLKTVQIVGVVA